MDTISEELEVSTLSIKERVAKSLEYLSNDDLVRLDEYLSFLRFRARTQAKPVLDSTKLARLYSEFAVEDQQLAEEGIEDYEMALQAEDTI